LAGAGIVGTAGGGVVLPVAGSEAQAERAINDPRTTVQYIFPVEIEVRGAPNPVDADELTQRALAALARGLQGLHGVGSA